MARVTLEIEEIANRITLRGLLERAGHQIVDVDPHIHIAETPNQALRRLGGVPVLVLATMTTLPEVIAAMEQGVFGYIFVPLQPGEASIMIARALQSTHGGVVASPQADSGTRSLQEVESEHILTTLRHCKNNQAKAAKILGIGRNTLWRKLKKISAVDSET